ncbi:hypothetical protein [Chitinophaga varians]|uniref:hypothetical protein n=1 Tax=Chitinophaga varians TaxID=2202339 RepID=UPI00165F1EF2|nr:hypothetical protein [Chitinophaga varians]MBC9912559.1 hypothetical protein [Chitinophaga varians]
MENSKQHFTWYGSASSEAGPFMITAVEDFTQWRGSDDALPIGYRVKYHGPLINELPSRFQTTTPVLFADEAGLLQFIQSLIDEIYLVQPEITMREQRKMTVEEIVAAAKGAASEAAVSDARESWQHIWHEHKHGSYHFSLEDKNLLHLGIGIETDYSRICETALAQDEVAVASFGTNAQALFWDVQPNTVTLAIDHRRTSVFFITALTNTHREKALQLVMDDTKHYEAGQLSLPTGRGALVWAPMTQGDLGAPTGLSLVADLNPPVQLNSLNILKVGTAFKVKPGIYDITCGWNQIEENDFAWVQLRLQP